MPMQYGSGKNTNKYDAAYSTQTLDNIQHTKETVDNIKCDIDTIINNAKLQSELTRLLSDNCNYETTRLNNISINVTNITYIVNTYKFYITIFNKILRSKLFRFLNYFFHWYTPLP